MTYSLIVPIFNEEDNIPSLYKRLIAVMGEISDGYEIIFINDGSHDNSQSLLEAMHQKNERIKIINFSRNFGHQIAVSAGLNYCSGDKIAILDADLQDPPEILPKFFKALENGCDVVYAVRKQRKEIFLKKIAYHLFYRFLKLMVDIEIPLDAGDFCVMNKRVVKALNSLPERNRFVRGLRSWIGFKQIGLEYERSARYAGKSKYNLKKLFDLAFDGIFSFSYLPLKIMFSLGFTSLFISVIGIIGAIYLRLFTDAYKQVPGFATTIILVMFVGGLQLFSIGIMGEYLRRIYDETKLRPQYIVESTVGFNS